MSTRNTVIRVAVLAAVFAALGAWAQGTVPHELSFTANLTNSGLPETGTHAFVFTMYDTPTGGTAGWTETQAAVSVDNGLVFTTLGATTPITPAIMTGAAQYLEVSVDGTVLTPRAAIVSVPYALRAETAISAESVGGLMGSEIQKRVSGACVGANAIQNIDPDGGVTCVAVSGSGSTGDITDVTTAAGSGLVGGVPSGNANIALMSCTNGQVLKSNGTAWGCAADVDTDTDTNTTYSAGAGLTLGGTVFSIGNSAISNPMLVNSAVTVSPGAGLTGGGSVGLGSAITLALANCPANQIYKMNAGGTAWTCASESTTSYAAGAGLALAGNTFSLSTAGCVSGDVWKWNGSAWTCVPDTDTDTTYTAGAGLALAGTTLSLNSGGCVNGYVLKSNGAGGWTCQADTDTNTTYTAGTGLTLSGSNQFSLTSNTLTVTAGTGLTGGGTQSLGGTINIALGSPVAISNGGTGMTTAPSAAGQFLRSNAPNSWAVGTIQAGDIPGLNYVGLTGDQTVQGIKTFTSTITGSVSGSAGSFTGSLGGDVTGTQAATSVVALRGRPMAANAPAANQVLKWSGTSWAPSTLDATDIGTGVLPIARGGTGSTTQNFVDLTSAQAISGAKVFNSLVAAPDFVYSTARTGYFFIDPTSCVRQDNTVNNLYLDIDGPPSNTHGPLLFIGAAAPASHTITAVCPADVQTPPGSTVTITGGTLIYADNGANCLVGGSVRGKLQPSSGAGPVYGSIYSGSSSSDYATATGYNLTKAISPFTPFVLTRTLTAATMPYFELEMSQTAVSTNFCRFQGVILEYTVNRP